MRRNHGEEVEFSTMILWESLDYLIAFAGPQYELSIVPEDRKPLLSRHEERAQHYEVVSFVDN